MRLGGDLHPQVNPFGPELMVFVDGDFPDNPRVQNVSEETLNRARSELYEFCRTSLEEVVALQDNGRPVMASQLAQLRDYETAIETVRRQVEQKHATEATGYAVGEPQQHLAQGQQTSEGQIVKQPKTARQGQLPKAKGLDTPPGTTKGISH